MKKTKINEAVTLTDQGILVHGELALPIVIRDVVLLYNYSAGTMSPAVTCKYSIENVSLGVHNRFNCSYSPDTPPTCLKELRDNGIVIKDRTVVLFILATVFEYFFRNSPALTEQSQPPVKRFFFSEHSGWIHARGQWVYLTSGFGITRDGIDTHWYCTTQNAYLHYDPELSAQNAYLQLLEVLDLDFNSAAPILTSTILGLLNPLRNTVNLYPVPGLLISGPTSSGKTELATNLAHILTNKNGALGNVFILQNSVKDLKRAIDGLSDSTVILDDIRRSPSYSLREKISAALDSFIRICFSSRDDIFLLPVITGENGTLDHMPLSLRNRIIEIPLDTAPEAVRNRQRLITQLHGSPLLVRTFFRYFIQYLAGCFDCDSSFQYITDLEEKFSSIIPLPERRSRGYDNLYLSYLGFNIFLEYGKQQGMAPEDPRCLQIKERISKDNFIQKYTAILQTISDRQDMMDPESQAACLLLCLLKKIRLYEAEILDHASFTESGVMGTKHFYNTYGHQAILDLTKNYSGIIIHNTASIAWYPEQFVSRSLLVVHYDAFVHSYSEYSELCRDIKQPFPYSSLRNFLATLYNQHILLGEPRRDPDHPEYVNYKITDYPCYTSDGTSFQCKMTSVLVFNLKGNLKQEIAALGSCNYRFPGRLEFSTANVKACARALQNLA